MGFFKSDNRDLKQLQQSIIKHLEPESDLEQNVFAQQLEAVLGIKPTDIGGELQKLINTYGADIDRSELANILRKFERLIIEIKGLKEYSLEEIKKGANLLQEVEDSDIEMEPLVDNSTEKSKQNLIPSVEGTSSPLNFEKSYACYRHLQRIRNRITDLDEALLTKKQDSVQSAGFYRVMGCFLGAVAGGLLTAVIGGVIAGVILGPYGVAFAKLTALPGAILGGILGYKIARRKAIASVSRMKDGKALIPNDAKAESHFMRTLNASVEKFVKNQEEIMQLGFTKRYAAKLTTVCS